MTIEEWNKTLERVSLQLQAAEEADRRSVPVTVDDLNNLFTRLMMLANQQIGETK